MESELPRSHGQHYDQDPQNAAATEGHEDEQHHEKKSVLERVKARARKIKDTLAKHGYGHTHEEEDDNEEDEKLVEDPGVHGAPMDDSASVTAAPAPQLGVDSGLPKGNLEKPSVMEEDRDESIVSEPPLRSFAQWEDENSGVNLGSSTNVEVAGRPEDKHSSFSSGVHAHNINDPIESGRGQGEDLSDPIGKKNFTGQSVEGRRGNLPDSIGNVGGQEENFGHSGAGIGGSMGREEDPQAPPKDPFEAVAPSNYQTEVADPTGTREEIGITPIIHSLDKMGIDDEPHQKPKIELNQNLSTESHNQFSPEPMPTNIPTTDQHESIPKSFDASKPETSPVDRLSENQFSPELTPNNTPTTDQHESVSASKPETSPVDHLFENQFSPESTPNNTPTTDQHESVSASKPETSPFDHLSENQFSPEPTPINNPTIDQHESVPKSLDASKPETSPGDRSFENQFSPEPMPTNTPTTYTHESVPKFIDASKPENSPIDHLSENQFFPEPTPTNTLTTDQHESVPKSSDASKPETSPVDRLSENQFSPEPTPTNTPTTDQYESVPKSFDASKPETSPVDRLSENQFSPEPMPTNTPTTDQHESVPKSFDASEPKTSPVDRLSENPSNQSSYTQMISSAASSVANKAVSTKNVAASTIGYGGTETKSPDRDSANRPNEMHKGIDAVKPAGGAATEYMHGQGPDKGVSLSSKVQGGPDKVASVKEYCEEKLRPGDEDKALSEVISGASSNKGKGEEEEERERGGDDSRGVSEVVSDAVHKRAPEENEGEEETMGKVTETKEVKEQLGTGGGGGGGEVDGSGVGAGKGVVDMIRGTVGSWLWKGSEPQTSQGTTNVGNEGATEGEAAHGHGQDDHGETRPRDLSN